MLCLSNSPQPKNTIFNDVNREKQPTFKSWNQKTAFCSPDINLYWANQAIKTIRCNACLDHLHHIHEVEYYSLETAMYSKYSVHEQTLHTDRGTDNRAAPSSSHAHVLRIEPPYKELRESVGINFGDAIVLFCSGLMPHFLLVVMWQWGFTPGLVVVEQNGMEINTQFQPLEQLMTGMTRKPCDLSAISTATGR